MRAFRWAILSVVSATSGYAEIVVPARTIPPQSIIAPEDLSRSDATVPGAIADPAQAVGLEARVALYPGRPIRPQDLGPPAAVERNAIVPLVYDRGGILITTEGRSLDRAGLGEIVRVMNTASRSTVTARIGPDGAAYVSEGEP